MKKYEITDIAHPDNPNLHRIRAVTDLTEDVLKGMLGGYVESYDNLDQEGRAWISEDAIACENAVVCGDAVLTDHAVAKGCAYVGKNATVMGDATVQDDAIVCGGVIMGKSCVCGYALCRKYKLSVIDTENSNHVAKPYAEWMAEKNSQPTWRTAIRQDVDEAIQQSLTWRQFLNALERNGYEVRMGRKYPVLRPPGKERFVRFKTLGKRYTPEAIRTRILYPQFNRCFVKNLPRVQYGRLHGGKPRRKLTGLRALYYRYLYELGALPRKPSRPSYAVRQDAYKLDQRIRQMEFLSKHNIDTLEQLEAHRKALQTEIGQLQTKRKQLPKTDDVQSQCESANTALKQLRQEERLCRKIAEHSLEVQQHLTKARRDRAEQQKQEQERARDRRPDITTR